MSCANWKTEIALYAGGDLGSDAAGVEAHLSECAECRALLAELQEDRALLGELQEEPVVDALAAQVRRRVMAQVRVGRAWPAVWKLALAAALVLAAILAFPRHARKEGHVARMKAPPAVEPVRPAAPPAIVPAAHRVRRRQRRAPVERAQAPRPGPPLLVQFVTDDPEIVIYWLVDQKPEGD